MKNYYITTPIYYVNDLPHIGHAYTTIACDILSRYHKLKNENVYFLTGTDEHGQKVQNAAIQNKITPQEFTNKMSENFKRLVKFLNCNINDFIRTTEKRHIISTQSLWLKLLKNNQIYLGKYSGWYSIRDESFFDEKELTLKNEKYISPSGAQVQWVEEESYFFRLSEWKDKLLNFYNNNPNFIAPKSRYNEIINFVKAGLKDLSISRTSFDWGIKVPGNEKHVMYVWIDALQNYLSALEYPNLESNLYKKFWPAIHVVGKDILRFHCIYWPAFLLAANLSPPKRVFAHGWWTNNGQKISKSIGNVIDPFDLINEFGLDEVRYFLFREVPFGEDGDFSKKAIINRINNDLANDYGNLIQRVCSFIYKNCGGIVNNNFDLINDDKKILNESIEIFHSYKNNMDKESIHRALINIFELISLSNIYIDNQSPWKLKNIDKNRMNTVLSILIELIKRITILFSPIIPGKSKNILKLISYDISNISFDNYEILPNNPFQINKPNPFFPKYEN